MNDCGREKLKLQVLYPCGWMTVGMLEPIGDLSWVKYPPPNIRVLEPKKLKLLNGKLLTINQ